MTYYIIRHKIDNELYWSNKDGWGDKKSADIFDLEERKEYTLPIDGKWVEV